MVVKEDKRRGWMAYMFATQTGKSGNGHHLGGRDTVENAGRIRAMFKELARIAFPDQDLYALWDKGDVDYSLFLRLFTKSLQLEVAY